MKVDKSPCGSSLKSVKVNMEVEGSQSKSIHKLLGVYIESRGS